MNSYWNRFVAVMTKCDPGFCDNYYAGGITTDEIISVAHARGVVIWYTPQHIESKYCGSWIPLKNGECHTFGHDSEHDALLAALVEALEEMHDAASREKGEA